MRLEGVLSLKSFAIVLVCYNRLPGIKRLLKSLEKVDYDNRNDIHLIFSIDHSGTNSIESFAESYTWQFGEKHIRAFKERQGLRSHVLQCGDYTNDYDIVAVLEDDLYVSDSFYHYAYQASEYYWDEDSVAGISLYSFQKNWLDWLIRFEPQRNNYDTYFLKVAMSWGQIWVRHKWRQFIKWYRENEYFEVSDNIPSYLNSWPESSWLKYHDRYCIETNRYFVYPYVSISTNFSDAGEHALFGVTDHQVELMYGKKEYSFPQFNNNAIVYDEYMNREGLGHYIGVDENDLTTDLYGTKKSNLWSKYLLSTNHYNYHIVKRFALALRPIELSIIENIDGDGIFLYDTSRVEHNDGFNGKYNRILYSIRSHSSKELLLFSLKLFKEDIIKKLNAHLHL